MTPSLIAMTKSIAPFLIGLFLLQTGILAQTTAIPDTDFEQALIDEGIDSDATLNGQILDSDAASATYLSLSYKNISDLTGIEAFVNLEHLYVDNNQLTSLDLSANISLEVLECSYNQLTSLDISNNYSLTQLWCLYNQLPSLFVANNTALRYLWCPYNQIGFLDVSNNPDLLELNCEENQLSTLDVSNQSALTLLVCNSNQISNLDVSDCTSLEQLFCGSNQLTNLDVSNNTSLTSLSCESNQLTTLDVKFNTALTYLACKSNQLTSLDITGNTAITNLSCGANQLAGLDVSNNTLLKWLYCETNDIAFLDVSNNTALKGLWCHSNQLSHLETTSNPVLTHLYCGTNQLSSLDVSANPALDYLSCAQNQLTFLDLSDNTTLSHLWVRDNLPMLQICVDDVIDAINKPSWYKDSSAYYSENCAFPLALEGEILIDSNQNCLPDAMEPAFNEPQLVRIANGSDTIYAATFDQGNYLAHLDTGLYTLSPVTTYPYRESCPADQQVYIDTNFVIKTADFVWQDTLVCPFLEVDIAAPFLRRCFPNKYTVSYANSGTMTAQNAYMEVQMDTTLYYLSSSIPLANQVGNVFTFNLGNLAPEQAGQFTILVTVSCASAPGQLHCATAHIFPDSLCDPGIPHIRVQDTCLADSVRFKVTNKAGDFPAPVPYWILKNDLFVDSGQIMLVQGQSEVIRYHKGYAAHNYQLLLAPDFTDPIVSSIVNCDTNVITLEPSYTPDPNLPFLAMDCQNNRGSYDPNDKQATPQGFGPNHLIRPNKTINYLIRFQNTGTDTAIFVNIFDTISPNLDISTLKMGVSSHSYSWQLYDDSVLRIIFSPIMLPDSHINEAASHGFIKYSLQQKAHLANGTVIDNSASIYFDYNLPVQTNTVSHTICDDCPEMSPGNYDSDTLLVQTVCDSFQLNNQVYYSGGTHTQHLLNTMGFDSTIVLQLTKLASSYDTLITSACSSYTSPSGSFVWYASGAYQDTLLNSAGCDSIISIDLAINNSNANIPVSACNNYTSPSGNHTWSGSGIYNDTIMNTKGCDSLLTIQLSILDSSSTSLAETSCDRFTLNNQTYATSGTYSQTLTNAAGCDSLITLDLTINKVDTQVSLVGHTLIAQTPDAVYQWLDCDDTYAIIPGAIRQSYSPGVNGNYAVSITKDNCMDTSACHSFNLNGIPPFELDQFLSVYPNPTTGRLTVDLNRTYQQIDIRTVNIIGEQMSHHSFVHVARIELELPEEAGIYFLLINDTNGDQATVKIIKH